MGQANVTKWVDDIMPLPADHDPWASTYEIFQKSVTEPSRSC